MEKSTLNNTLEMYQLDLEELNKFINSSLRPNVKRQLEEHKKLISFQLESEKKKLEKIQNTDTTSTTQNIPKVNFESISKYALDTTNNQFIK